MGYPTRIYYSEPEHQKIFDRWLAGESQNAIAQSVRTDLYEPTKSDSRWQAFLERYDATDEDLSNIRFNPGLPAAVEELLAAD
jgi:hypothetical protein